MTKELCLTIPCEPGKPSDLKGPLYIYDGRDSMNAYKCPHCGQTGPRRAPLETHMGLDPAKPPGCRVLKAEAEKRRGQTHAANAENRRP